MDIQRDKFLTEAMEECWHEEEEYEEYSTAFRGYYVYRRCKHCKEEKDLNSTFSTWEGFGKLWNWAKEQEWWKDIAFSVHGDGYHCYPNGRYAFGEHIIHPDRFADAVYDFLKEREDGS